MRYAVNCSILFPNLPLLERAAAARAAGFAGVEFWWPFAEPVPSRHDVDDFIASIEDAGVSLVNLNLFAGDMAAGDRGLLSWPGRDDEFRANLDVIAHIGERLECRRFNALYGNRIDGVAPEAQDLLAVDRLSLAAEAVAGFGGVIVVEPLSGVAAYPLRTSSDVIEVIVRADRSNVGMLCDVYHLAMNGDDVAAVVDEYFEHIAHVQIADAPGRGKPGSGGLPIGGYIDRLHAQGYAEWIAFEYLSLGSVEQDFDWMAGSSRR